VAAAPFVATGAAAGAVWAAAGTAPFDGVAAAEGGAGGGEGGALTAAPAPALAARAAAGAGASAAADAGASVTGGAAAAAGREAAFAPFSCARKRSATFGSTTLSWFFASSPKRSNSAMRAFEVMPSSLASSKILGLPVAMQSF
jgi:hypothetical protein